MPDTLDNIDWRNRDLFPPDEPVTVWGRDQGGNLRTASARWGDIEGDIVTTAAGPLAIETVTCDRDLPLGEEELEPAPPRALRDSRARELPCARAAENPSRWEARLMLARTPHWIQRGVHELARDLGVTAEAILAQGVELDAASAAYLVPERDHNHHITGLASA